MFYPEKMSRVTIAAPQSHIRKIINVLYELNALHIEEYRGKELSIGSPLKDAEKISELLLDINSIKSVIILHRGENVPVVWKECEKLIKETRDKVSSLYGKLKELEEELSVLEQKERASLFLTEAGIKSFEQLLAYRTLEMVYGRVKKPLDTKDIITFGTNEEKSPVVIFFRKNDNNLKKIVQQNIEEERLEFDDKGSVSSSLARIKQTKDRAKKQQQEIRDELDAIAKKSGKILSAESALLEELKKNEAPLKFAASPNAFVAEGWVPTKNISEMEKRVKAIANSVFIKIEDAKEAPTKLEHSRMAKPFEFFLNLYSLPKYGEIDPTWLILISFPIFYGFMLGDIGYGLAILALSLLLRPRLKKIRALVDISIISAVSTIFFGFIFGEFFGTEEVLGYHLTAYFHRVEHVNEMITFSALLGLIHVNTGFILGFINEKRHHGLMKAVLAKISWMLMEVAALLFALNVFGIISVNMYVPLVLFVASAAMLFKGEGLRGMFEIPSLLGNILSYARLAAIGLASASLAIVVNSMAGPLFQAGGPMAALGIVILILGHSINIAIGIMDAFLQSMRLHYVEMFTKFYGGSGKPYRPFGQDN